MKLKPRLPLRDAIAVTVVGLMVSAIIGQDVFVTPKKGKVGLDETVIETTDMDKAPATDVFLQDGFMRAVSPILRPPSNYRFRKFKGADTSIDTWVDIQSNPYGIPPTRLVQNDYEIQVLDVIDLEPTNAGWHTPMFDGNLSRIGGGHGPGRVVDESWSLQVTLPGQYSVAIDLTDPEPTPDLSKGVRDASGIDEDSIKITFNGAAVADLDIADITNGIRVTFAVTPKNGANEIIVNAQDKAGNGAEAKETFNVP